MRGAIIAALTALALGVAPVLAQSRDDLVQAFSGQWFLFDPAFSTGTNSCSLILQSEAPSQLTSRPRDLGDLLQAEMRDCTFRVAPITYWTIEGDILLMYDATGDLVAELGGNQRRVTGTTVPDGGGLVVERASGDGSSEEIALAVQRHRCYFRGFTDQCIDDDDRRAPEFDAESGLAEVALLTNLVARSQPRRDSATIGTIPQGTCVRVNQCLVASDGRWCRARFGDVTAWLPQAAVRQGEWPVYTYQANCPDD